jgi:hypothetical protein
MWWSRRVKNLGPRAGGLRLCSRRNERSALRPRRHAIDVSPQASRQVSRRHLLHLLEKKPPQLLQATLYTRAEIQVQNVLQQPGGAPPKRIGKSTIPRDSSRDARDIRFDLPACPDWTYEVKLPGDRHQRRTAPPTRLTESEGSGAELRAYRRISLAMAELGGQDVPECRSAV